MAKLLTRHEVINQLKELEKFTDIQYLLGEFEIMVEVNGKRIVLDIDRMNKSQLTQTGLNSELRNVGIN